MNSRLFLGLVVALVIAATSNAKRGYGYEKNSYKDEDEYRGYVSSENEEMNGGMEGGMEGGNNGGEMQMMMDMLMNQDQDEIREMVCARIAAKLELVNQTVVPVGFFITTNQFLPLTRSVFDDINTIARFALASNIEVAAEDLVELAAFLEKVLHEELIAICDLELTPTIGEGVFMIADFLEELFEANASAVEEEEEEVPMKKGYPINVGGRRGSKYTPWF